MPLLADDSGARNAVWSILGRVCACLAVAPQPQLLSPQAEPETQVTVGVETESAGKIQQEAEIAAAVKGSEIIKARDVAVPVRLVGACQPKEDMSVLAGLTSVLAEGCAVVLEDLQQHKEEDNAEDEMQTRAGQDIAASTSRGREAKKVIESGATCRLK